MVCSVARRISIAVLVGAWLISGARLPANTLPKGEEVLDKYVEVTGGKEAYTRANNRVAKGKLSFAGIEGKFTLYTASPDKMYMEMELQNLGKFEAGANGTVAWERNPITGSRVKEGEERSTSLATALFNSDVHWRKVYKSARCLGEEKAEEKDCYKVELTPKEGKPVFKYYDKKSNLLVKMTMTVQTPQGELATDSFVSDYKKVNGLLVPHKVRNTVLTQEIVMTVDSVAENADIPDRTFELPEEVKKLAEKRNSK